MIEKGESWVEANEHALQLVRPHAHIHRRCTASHPDVMARRSLPAMLLSIRLTTNCCGAVTRRSLTKLWRPALRQMRWCVAAF